MPQRARFPIPLSFRTCTPRCGALRRSPGRDSQPPVSSSFRDATPAHGRPPGPRRPPRQWRFAPPPHVLGITKDRDARLTQMLDRFVEISYVDERLNPWLRPLTKAISIDRPLSARDSQYCHAGWQPDVARFALRRQLVVTFETELPRLFRFLPQRRPLRRGDGARPQCLVTPGGLRQRQSPLDQCAKVKVLLTHGSSSLGTGSHRYRPYRCA